MQEQEILKPKQPAKKLLRFAFHLIETAGMVICLFSALGFLGSLLYEFDLLSHFRLQYFVLLICCLPFMLRRGRIFLIVFAVFALINASQIAALYQPAPAAKAGSPLLRLLTMNLQSNENQKFASAVACIRSLNPDVVAFEEINEAYKKYLTENLPEYKYSKILTGEAGEGVGLMSKLPLDHTEEHQFGKNFPLISSHVQTALGDIQVLAAHPMPPLFQDYWRQETIFFDNVAEISKKRTSTFVLIGDLNATEYGYQLSHFRSISHLCDSSKGFGIELTWPSYFLLLGINIDHCLFSDDLTAVARKVGPDIGSDHLPLYVELANRRRAHN